MKYAYFLDPTNTKRVLTIARDIRGPESAPEMHVGFAVNNPKHDAFTKAEGRVKAAGRSYASDAPSAPFAEDQTGFIQALQIVAEKAPKGTSARRIAQFHLEQYEGPQNLVYVSPMTSQKVVVAS